MDNEMSGKTYESQLSNADGKPGINLDSQIVPNSRSSTVFANTRIIDPVMKQEEHSVSPASGYSTSVQVRVEENLSQQYVPIQSN